MPCPVLWIAGEEDGSYAEQAKKIQQQKLLQHPHSKVWLAPNSGHRVPWQRTEEFIQELKSFLRNLNPRVYNDTNNSY
jgi:pimeloyl-ACP methyl ester carboxylesterase